MDTRVAVIAVVIEDMSNVEKFNQLLHQYSQYIIGRMGIPHREKKISLISVAVDAPADVISALSGKIGMLKGITAKTVYSRV